MISDPNYYAEDHLTTGQSFIITLAAKTFRLILKLLLSKPPDSGDVYALYGANGTGISTILAHYCKHHPIHPANESSTIMYLKSTPHRQADGDLRTIAELLSNHLLGHVDGDSRLSLETGLLISSIDIIVIDDAQHLNSYALAMIRYLNAKTGCRFILCGTPRLKKKLIDHPEFWSCLSYETVLPKMNKNELIDTVLPNLSYPRWKFNPRTKERSNIWRTNLEDHRAFTTQTASIN